jgi:hypothetical protein
VPAHACGGGIVTTPCTIHFARCHVDVWPQYLETVFACCGAKVPAAPVDDDDYRSKAFAWGHASSWQMCLYHEVGHSFVAARLGYDYSPALFATAHNIPRSHGFHSREEDLVTAFCRHVVANQPWPTWMSFPLREVLQGGVNQFRDIVGGLE